MRIVPITFASIVMLAAASAALSAARVSGAEAMQVMHERHEGMESIGNAFKALHREFDAPSPSVPTVRAYAGQIAGLSKKASGWFPAGTGPDVGRTGAKPEIWKDTQDFGAKLSAFQNSAQAFNAAAASNDLNAAKAHFAELGGTCKACHDSYRAEMHH